MLIPEFLSQYFWDVEVKVLDSERQSVFIIERILEKGDDRAVKWLKTSYTSEEIKSVAMKSRRLSPKSQNYWGIIYKIWPTQNQSIPPREGIWQR